MVTHEQRTYMIGKLYEARKKSVGGQSGNTNAEKQTGQNDRIVSRRETKDGTAGQIGKEFGMGEKNVRRAEKFAKGVDVLKQLSPEAADKVLKGQVEGNQYTEIQLGHFGLIGSSDMVLKTR